MILYSERDSTANVPSGQFFQNAKGLMSLCAATKSVLTMP